MTTSILRLLALTLMSSACIRFYYSGSSVFPRTFLSEWWWWVAGIVGLYIAYKTWIVLTKKKTLEISALGVIAAFLIFLFGLSFAHASFAPDTAIAGVISGGFAIFGRTLFSCILPLGLVWLWWALGRQILRTTGFLAEATADRMLGFFMPTSVWFTLYATGLTVFGSIGLFNVATVWIMTIAMAIVSYRELGEWLHLATRPFATAETNTEAASLLDRINLKLITGEWAIIVATLVIGVGFLNIIRPTPIGWDDLGVYMNYPKLIAANGSIPEGVGFVPWQLVTAVGFLAGSVLQAFFINQLGGTLSFFAVFFALSGWLGNRRGHFHWPLVCAMLSVTMPMVIFQQARDMKLDTVVLFLSIAILYAAIHWIRNVLLPEIRDTGRVELLSRRNLFWIILIGTLTGFVFSVKITSLMLLLGLLGLFAYAFYGSLGLVWFFSLFIAAFTALRLWPLLNIGTLSDPIVISFVSTVGSIVGILSLGFCMLRSKTVRTVSVFAWLGVFFLAFFAPLAPWIAKNLSEIKEVSVLRIVTGEPAGYAPDFSRIYSDEKRIEIETNLTDLSINSSGQTANEDFGRYFGNEKGINNYLKLPYNRTFQKTQNGEFTEIGYVFLALFPLILIFLPGARTWFVAIVVLSTAAYWFYAMFPDTLGHLAAFSDLLKLNTAIVRAFDSLVLPIGYLAIIAGFAIATAAILFGLKSTGNTQTDTDHELLRLLGVFTVIYGFVYLVSSYGVPWYGILLYFCLFSLISIAGSYATGDEASADSREPGIGFYSAIVIAIILSSWIGRTTVSDAISHLANVEYSAYRLGNLAQEETLVAYHPNYFPIVSALNLRDESAAVREILDAPDVRNLNALLVSASITPKDLIGLAQVLASIETSNLREMMPTLSSIAEMALKQEARKARLRVYHAAFSPSQDNQADTPIYRIGTFLSYYIHDNIHRYYEDSLLFNYRSWFDHTDPDTVAWRMRETGFKHLLLDVNASTIDVSPPYELTARFENLLLGLRSEGFRLVSTDNPCLESALRENEQLTPEEYLARAGVSYDSATLLPDGNYQYTSRYSKRLECYAYLVQIVREGRVNSSSEYSYLLPYAGMIERNLATIDSIFESAKNGERNHYQASGAIERLTGLQSGWMALFEIIDQEAAEMSVEILETNNAETATPAAPGENAEASESDSPELR